MKECEVEPDVLWSAILMIKIGKYLALSIFITVLDISVMSLLVEVIGLYYIYSVTISYIIAFLMKFILNREWVFKDSPGVWITQLRRFTIVSVSGLLLTNVVMWIGVEYLLIHYFIVKVAAVGVVFIWTYIFHNMYSFKSDANIQSEGGTMKKTIGRVLRRLPIDLGQGEMRFDTMAKVIGMRAILSEVKEVDNLGKALDIGCREGHQSRWLKRVGYEVVSIDIEPEYEGALTVDVNDGLPFPDQHFDLIWCSEVIEHLNDPLESLNEILRVAKTDGFVILTTPNSYAWIFRLASLVGFPPQKIQNPGHKHFFNYSNLKNILESTQYSIIYRIWGYFPYAGIKLRTERWRDTSFLSPSFVVGITKK